MHDCQSKYKDRMECIHCGWTHSNPNIHRNCPKLSPKVIVEPKPVNRVITTPPPNISLLQKAVHFGKAVVKDVAHGMERCTEEEIEERLSICKECPFAIHKQRDELECSKCGCRLNRRHVYLNKLAWKHEVCPDNPPRW